MKNTAPYTDQTNLQNAVTLLIKQGYKTRKVACNNALYIPLYIHRITESIQREIETYVKKMYAHSSK